MQQRLLCQNEITAVGKGICVGDPMHIVCVTDAIRRGLCNILHFGVNSVTLSNNTMTSVAQECMGVLTAPIGLTATWTACLS